MKLLTKIQIVLTVLAAVAFIVVMRMASWIHSMAYADPVRQEWQPRLGVISSVVWFGVVGSWLLFSIVHLIVVVTRKPQPKIDV